MSDIGRLINSIIIILDFSHFLVICLTHFYLLFYRKVYGKLSFLTKRSQQTLIFLEFISCIALKRINIWWIRTRSQPYEKIMSSIIRLTLVSLAHAFGISGGKN